jgi:NitT/TauT family transport system ATP-binding protein
LIVRLPSVPVGTITGLLELIHESDGRAPLSELAGALQFDIEDLLGCVAGVELLGFGTAADGQLALTVDGRRFIESPIDQRKARFREVLMSRVPNVKRVVEEIQAADGHVVTAESILDWLERHFSADEARRQLDLLISWGRYADAFSFDAETGEITAAE